MLKKILSKREILVHALDIDPTYFDINTMYYILLRCMHIENSKQKIMVSNLQKREKEFDIVTHMHQ